MVNLHVYSKKSEQGSTLKLTYLAKSFPKVWHNGVVHTLEAVSLANKESAGGIIFKAYF